MDEETILSKFDHLVEAGLVLYDPQQKIVELEDDGLKVVKTLNLLTETLANTHPSTNSFSHPRSQRNLAFQMIRPKKLKRKQAIKPLLKATSTLAVTKSATSALTISSQPTNSASPDLISCSSLMTSGPNNTSPFTRLISKLHGLPSPPSKATTSSSSTVGKMEGVVGCANTCN
jgi:hypothetical protein